MSDDRINWYRVALDKEQLKELTRRSDLRGLAQAGTHVLVVLALGLFCWWSFGRLAWPWVVLAFFVHGTVLQFLGGAGAFHELCHGTPFKTRWLNEIFLWIVSFLTWGNFVHFRASHVRHHQYTVHHPQDLEVILPGSVRLRDFLWSFVVHPLAIWGVLKTQVRHSLGILEGEWENRIFSEEGAPRKEAMFWWARIQLAGHVGLAVLFIAAGHPILIPIFLTPFWGGWLTYLCALPQHYALQPNVPDWRKSCRTVLQDPITSYLYWNMNYHTEHHMCAAVPFFNLRKLHRAIAHDSPRPNRGLLNAWKEMIHCARELKKNPGYVFDAFSRKE